jgi:hypothetical protein
MNWKFWERNTEPEYFFESADIPATTLYRWFLYDSNIANPNRYAVTAGFIPVSAEGDEMERKESTDRLLQVVPYKAVIDMMASMNGQVLAETLTTTLREDGVLGDHSSFAEDMELMIDIYTRVSTAVLIPAFAAALELGILVNPGSFVSGDFHEH